MTDLDAELARNGGITDLRARIREHWHQLSPAGQDVCCRLGEMAPEQLLHRSSARSGWT